MRDTNKGEVELAGVVLVFREGVTKEEAAKRLAALNDVLEGSAAPPVQTFDPWWGYPCFYIP